MDALTNYLHEAVRRERESNFQQTDQLTLGDIIDKLEAIPLKSGDDEQTVVFDFEFLIPTSLDSWRGSYSELALGWTYIGYAPDGNCPDHNGAVEKKLSSFIQELKDAVGHTFYGWKGGEFTMSRSTPVWVANPGNTGNTGVKDVIDNGYEVILMTGYYDY